MSQAVFHCVECGYMANADVNAAMNILDRASNKTGGGTASDVEGRVGGPMKRQPPQRRSEVLSESGRRRESPGFSRGEDVNNNKTENSNMFDVNVTAFQNGHQLDTAIYSDQTPEGYDENSSTNALQPGATGTVTLGYVLEDETNPVTVEVSGTLDMSGQKVTHEFALQ